MVSIFNDFPLFQNNDVIIIFDRRNTMAYDNRSLDGYIP